MVKNRMQMARLELALLNEVHHTRDAGESERAVSNKRDGRVKFQPRIGRQSSAVRCVDRRE